MPSPLLVAASITSALALGLVPVLLSTLQGFFHQSLAIPEQRLTRLHKTMILSWVVLMPLSGWLVDRVGVQDILFAGNLGLALAIAWLALCQNYSSIVWGVMGLSVAGAFTTTGTVVLMRDGLKLMSGWSMAAALCLGYVFVALASLLVPRVLPWLIRNFGFRHAVLSLGLVCLIPSTLVALARSDIPPPEQAIVLEATFQDAAVWLVILVAFFYFPLERSLEVWPKPYLEELGYTARSLTRLLVGFWVAFLVWRFGLGWMIRQGNEAWLVLVLLVVSSMILGNLVGAYAPSSGYVGVWLLGACYGPLFPALLGLLLSLPGTRGIPGLAVGVLFALSALNSLTVQPWFLAYARSHTTRMSMRIPMILGLLMAAPILIVALIR